MKRRLRRINTGEVNPSLISPSRASSAIVTTPPKADPRRVTAVIWLLTLAAFAAIAADCWMSWEGFSTIPIDWWVAVTLTAIIACSQLGSGIIQSLGGDPFAGVGGSSGGDGLWGITLRGLYALDIFSNFAGFGGVQYLSLDRLMSSPGGTIGLLLWNATLAILLAFGDEILFRLRDRVMIGARKNAQLYRLHDIQVKAHDVALNEYCTRATEQAKVAGQQLNVSFDWLEEESRV